MGQNAERGQVLGTLPSIMPYNAELFIKNHEEEEISWTVYLNPISNDLWVTLVIVSLIIACVFSIIEKHSKKFHQNHIFHLNNFLIKSWIAFKANFGGKPSSVNSKTNAYRIVMFICLLSGSLFWIAYRASLTSELSVINLKQPFNDLEGLLTSNYRYFLEMKVVFWCAIQPSETR